MKGADFISNVLLSTLVHDERINITRVLNEFLNKYACMDMTRVSVLLVGRESCCQKTLVVGAISSFWATLF